MFTDANGDYIRLTQIASSIDKSPTESRNIIRQINKRIINLDLHKYISIDSNGKGLYKLTPYPKSSI